MQVITVLLAAASITLAQTVPVPTLSSYSAAGCSGTPLATWSGVSQMAFCQATPGAIALSVAADMSMCEIDLYTTCE